MINYAGGGVFNGDSFAVRDSPGCTGLPASGLRSNRN